MAIVEPTEYASVLETIRQWPPESRRDLVRDVIKTIAVEAPSRLPRGFSAAKARGLLKTDHPAPNDEECDRILEEELIKKYGS
jgi:hypothetical protein